MSLGKIRTIGWAAPLLIAAGLSSVGCKSGMKLPGASMFGWSREPSAETLASNMSSPKVPDSPANKYSPSTLATTPANKPAGTTATTTSPYGAVGSYGSQSTAAAANGYQTGQYGTTGAYPTASAATTSLASNVSNRTAAPTGGIYSGNAGLINPAPPTSVPNSAYPGSTSLNPALASNLNSPTIINRPPQLPTSTAPSAYGSQTPTSGAMPNGVGVATAWNNTAANMTPNAAATNLPPTGVGYSMPNMSVSQTSSMPNVAQPSMPPSIVGSAQTIPAGYPAPGAGQWQSISPTGAQQPAGANSFPSNQPSAPTWQQPTTGLTPNAGVNYGTSTPAASAAANSAVSGGYRPGTTGRTTTYNFGATTGSAPATATPTLGTSVPTGSQPALPGYTPNIPAYNPSPSYNTGTGLPPNTASGSAPGVTSPVPGGTLYR